MALLYADDPEPAGLSPDPEVEALRSLAVAIILKAAADLTSVWAPTPIRGSALTFFDPANAVFQFWCACAGCRPEVVLGAMDRARASGHVIRAPYRQVPGSGRPARHDKATA